MGPFTVTHHLLQRLVACLFGLILLFSRVTAAAPKTPTVAVVITPGLHVERFSKLAEALQLYLSDFNANAHFAASDIQADIATIRDEHSADWALVLGLNSAGDGVTIGVFALKDQTTQIHSSTAGLPADLDDPSRYLALLVRGELAALVNEQPKDTPKPVANTPPRSTAKPAQHDEGRVAVAVNGAGLVGFDKRTELGISATGGYAWGRGFVGGVAEWGYVPAISSQLGDYETRVTRLGLDARVGRLSDGGAWSLLWGGQAGLSWARTGVALAGIQRQVTLADSFAPFIRVGLWNLHQVSKRFAFSWDVSAEVLPLASKVLVGREVAYDSSHFRLRLAMGGLFYL